MEKIVYKHGKNPNSHIRTIESNMKTRTTMKRRWQEGIVRNNSNFGVRTKELWKNPKYKKHMSNVHKGQKAWNKNLTKETDKRVKLNAEAPITHHINGNHFDNRPENLMTVSRGEHLKIHISQGDIVPWSNIKC